jgi:hypothetical protein
MKFAKIVFWVAGIWGVLVITPMFFLRSAVEKQAPAAVLTHPEFYYGFACLALMWQVSFFILARDPARYRAMIVPPALAKFGYAATVVILHLNGQIGLSQLFFAAADFILGVLFIIAFARIPRATEALHLRRE